MWFNWIYYPLPGADPGFSVRRANLKKLRRAEGGAKIFWVFRVKNHDFTPKNHIFSNFSGARAGCAPPWIRPWLLISLFEIHSPKANVHTFYYVLLHYVHPNINMFLSYIHRINRHMTDVWYGLSFINSNQITYISILHTS